MTAQIPRMDIEGEADQAVVPNRNGLFDCGNNNNNNGTKLAATAKAPTEESACTRLCVEVLNLAGEKFFEATYEVGEQVNIKCLEGTVRAEAEATFAAVEEQVWQVFDKLEIGKRAPEDAVWPFQFEFAVAEYVGIGDDRDAFPPTQWPLSVGTRHHLLDKSSTDLGSPKEGDDAIATAAVASAAGEPVQLSDTPWRLVVKVRPRDSVFPGGGRATIVKADQSKIVDLVPEPNELCCPNGCDRYIFPATWQAVSPQIAKTRKVLGTNLRACSKTVFTAMLDQQAAISFRTREDRTHFLNLVRAASCFETDQDYHDGIVKPSPKMYPLDRHFLRRVYWDEIRNEIFKDALTSNGEKDVDGSASSRENDSVWKHGVEKFGDFVVYEQDLQLWCLGGGGGEEESTMKALSAEALLVDLARKQLLAAQKDEERNEMSEKNEDTKTKHATKTGKPEMLCLTLYISFKNTWEKED